MSSEQELQDSVSLKTEPHGGLKVDNGCALKGEATEMAPKLNQRFRIHQEIYLLFNLMFARGLHGNMEVAEFCPF